MSKEETLKLEEQLRARIPHGEAVGNVSLMRHLEYQGWSEQMFWEVRNNLIDQGVLVLGRGRGGSVRLADEARVSPALRGMPSALTLDANLKRLSDWFAAQLDGEWEYYPPQIFLVSDSCQAVWRVSVPIKGTELEDRYFKPVITGRREFKSAWIRCEVANGTYQAMGDLDRLSLMLQIFLDWAQARVR